MLMVHSYPCPWIFEPVNSAWSPLPGCQPNTKTHFSAGSHGPARVNTRGIAALFFCALFTWSAPA